MSDQHESLILYKNHLSSHFQGGSSYLLAGPITTCAVGGHALIPTVNVDVRGCNTCVDFTTSRVAAPPAVGGSWLRHCQCLNGYVGGQAMWPPHSPTTWPLTHATVSTVVCPILKSLDDRFPPIYYLFFVLCLVIFGRDSQTENFSFECDNGNVLQTTDNRSPKKSFLVCCWPVDPTVDNDSVRIRVLPVLMGLKRYIDVR